MQPFEAPLPDFSSPAVKPLRTKDAAALAAAIAALKPPFAPDVAAELVALAYAHVDANVRKKAGALVTKHVPDAAAFKAAYKTLANAQQHVMEERVMAFDHPYRLDIAKAVLFHRMMCATLPFEEDAATRGAILDIIVDTAKREGETDLNVGQVYWYWRDESGWATYMKPRALPVALFEELAQRRERHAFDGLTFHGGGMTTLPAEMVQVKPWLKKLSLAFCPMTTVPEVVWELENLEELELLGTEMVDVPAGIARLPKLRRLDLGNMKKMKTVPESVCALGKLEWLRIGNGSINKVPEGVTRMSGLREIELQSTSVSKLPAGMAKMPSLKKVNVRWSKVDDATVAALVEAGIEVER